MKRSLSRPPHPARGLIVLTLAALSAGVFGCEEDGSRTTTLQIFAASSLTEAFEALEQRFEALNPEVEVSLTFAGSQVLRLQLEGGAGADVFASANRDHMDALVRGGVIEQTQTLGSNALVLIVPRDNPSGLTGFEDLTSSQRLVIGTEHAPVGRYSRELLRRANDTLGPAFAEQVLERVVSEEKNVRLVRAKVELGEADAAIVYRSDALGRPSLQTLEIPAAINVEARYSMGLVMDSQNATMAREWIGFVASDQGKSILAEHGFGAE